MGRIRDLGNTDEVFDDQYAAGEDGEGQRQSNVDA